MKSVYCLNPISNAGMSRFDDTYCIADSIENADSVLLRSASMHEMTLPDSLLAIGRAGAGVNNIPLDSCAKKGIVVFNTPGANANGVKELVIAGLMLASRDIAGGCHWVRENKDDPNIAKTAEKAKKAFAGNEIKGKKLGVIGLGAIGVLVANAASELGMEVFGCDPYLSIQNAVRLSHHITIVKDNDEIYNQCDYITIHVPALDSTKGMLNKRAFDQMKDGVKILNFARDILVNDDDMAEALKCGKVKKYITDFPNAKTSAMEGVIATPHLGASTEESEDNCAVMAADELKDYLENGNIKNSVNYPACDMGICQVAGRIGLLHANIPNMIGQITSILAAEGINIANMTNKSRDKYAYTLLDLENPVKEEAVAHLEKISGMYKVRVIKG